MAELADAQDSGSCEHLLMQVQVLLSAPLPKKTNLLLVRFSFHCPDNRLATMLLHCRQTLFATCISAADAPLGNNIALLALLRSLRSLQVLLSAPLPKKTNLLLVRFSFHCPDNRLATMLLHCRQTLFAACIMQMTRLSLCEAIAITLVSLATSPVVRTKCDGL